MHRVRLGILGVGGMGGVHARTVMDGKIQRCDLTAVSDINPNVLEPYHNKVKTFTDNQTLIHSGLVDAVLIATPHRDHMISGIAALNAGLHVLVEKPISVQKADCKRLIAAHRSRRQVFAAMFNQRTDPHFKQVRELITGGDVGQILRVTWIATNWFRTDAYYASGTWRATWEGEGGGVLMNQAPHQLDLLQWLCGMPKRVWGFCGLGKRHKIEVEDEVTAYFEYADGATGVFITSTGEAPGTNRLEIAGDRGKVVVENDKIVFWRNLISAREFCRKSKERFGQPPVETVEIPVSGHGGQHAEIIQNFVDAILDGRPLIAPAEEGIRSVELANAILYSSLKGKPVELPLNSRAYELQLQALVRASKTRTKTGAKRIWPSSAKNDLLSSFNK